MFKFKFSNAPFTGLLFEQIENDNSSTMNEY